MPRRVQRIRRTQLYQKVWELEPEALASELGVDREPLHALCVKHSIPWPPNDYWRRKAAGLPVMQNRLPPTEGDAFIELTPRIKKSVHHSLVAALLRRRAEVSEKRLQTYWMFPPQERRRLAMMSRIFFAVEKIGIRPAIGKLNIVEFGMRDAMIRCRLREKLTKRGTQAPVQGEPRLPERLQQRNLQSTGFIAFEIDREYVEQGTRREWIEAPLRPFEKILPEIVNAIRTALMRRLEFEREARLRQDSARAREYALWIERDQQELDERRWLKLCTLAEQLHTLENVQYLLHVLRASCAEPSLIVGDRTAGAWLEWVQEQLKKREALLTNVSAILDEISKTR